MKDFSGVETNMKWKCSTFKIIKHMKRLGSLGERGLISAYEGHWSGNYDQNESCDTPVVITRYIKEINDSDTKMFTLKVPYKGGTMSIDVMNGYDVEKERS